MEKVSGYAIVINSLQILAAVLIAGYTIAAEGLQLSGSIEKILVIAAAMVVIWGAVVDIREAVSARHMARQRDMLEDAYRQMEELNLTLRAQRHDFMNHIQVVYSLTEMEEYASALEYMDRVYGDVQKVGRALKTSITAVNALIAAKMADCEEDGIVFSADIRSPWKDMPVPGWEMCRVLGNLIDNAAEAMGRENDRKISICLWEDARAFRFYVENTGKKIDAQMAERVFEAGFSTKGTGRGMGLHIVREILREHGGDIRLDESSGGTRFAGEIPRTSEVVKI